MEILLRDEVFTSEVTGSATIAGAEYDCIEGTEEAARKMFGRVSGEERRILLRFWAGDFTDLPETGDTLVYGGETLRVLGTKLRAGTLLLTCGERYGGSRL